MKKSLALFLPILLLPTITACQDVEHSVICINVAQGDNEPIELSIDEFKTLVDSKQPFAVEFYSPYCGHCEDLGVLINKYVEETRNLIYKVDLSVFDLEEFKEFQSLYPDIIVDEYVPSIRFVKNGTLTFEVNRKKFESYTALRSVLNAHFTSSRVSITSSMTSFNNYQSYRPSHIAFAYTTTNPTSVKFASDYLLTDEMAKKDYDVLLINTGDLAENCANIKDFYNASYDTFIAYKKSDGSIKTADYTASDFSFTSFLS